MVGQEGAGATTAHFISSPSDAWSQSFAVWTGALQAVRTAAVFLLSALLFSGYERSQELNVYKCISIVVVCLGMAAYSLTSEAKPPPARAPI